jgi:hypothetical protein
MRNRNGRQGPPAARIANCEETKPFFRFFLFFLLGARFEVNSGSFLLQFVITFCPYYDEQ